MDRLEPRPEIEESARSPRSRIEIACGLGRPITRLTVGGRQLEADGPERIADAAIDRVLVVHRRPGHVEDHQLDLVHRPAPGSESAKESD